jgi:hypothetical protein
VISSCKSSILLYTIVIASMEKTLAEPPYINSSRGLDIGHPNSSRIKVHAGILNQWVELWTGLRPVHMSLIDREAHLLSGMNDFCIHMSVFVSSNIPFSLHGGMKLGKHSAFKISSVVIEDTVRCIIRLLRCLAILNINCWSKSHNCPSLLGRIKRSYGKFYPTRLRTHQVSFAFPGWLVSHINIQWFLYISQMNFLVSWAHI